jgi:hypothetical protein
MAFSTSCRHFYSLQPSPSHSFFEGSKKRVFSPTGHTGKQKELYTHWQWTRDWPVSWMTGQQLPFSSLISLSISSIRERDSTATLMNLMGRQTTLVSFDQNHRWGRYMLSSVDCEPAFAVSDHSSTKSQSVKKQPFKNLESSRCIIDFDNVHVPNDNEFVDDLVSACPSLEVVLVIYSCFEICCLILSDWTLCLSPVDRQETWSGINAFEMRWTSSSSDDSFILSCRRRHPHVQTFFLYASLRLPSFVSLVVHLYRLPSTLYWPFSSRSQTTTFQWVFILVEDRRVFRSWGQFAFNELSFRFESEAYFAWNSQFLFCSLSFLTTH